MMTRLTLFLILFALVATGCKDRPGSPGSPTALPGSTSKYPIEWPARKYTQPADEVIAAWRLVEISYFVVNDKFIHATKDTKQAVEKEIKGSIFNVNPKVEQLFKDAIKKQPDNPINHAAYAIYLKPRRREKGNTFVPTWNEALQEIDKAIELLPDESSYYVTKIYIISAPHQAHEWLLEGALEDVTIGSKLPEIGKLFNLAEKYDPNNSYLNYWHAQLLFRYTSQDKLPKVWSQIKREIHAGNQKTDNYFVFGAPLAPRQRDPFIPLLTAQQTDPIYADQWLQFGSYSGQTIEFMVQELLKTLKWPKDKDTITDIMFMYYNLGRTEPYDRSYFSMQQVVLDKIRHDVDVKSEEGHKLAEAGRFLDAQYQTQGNNLYTYKIIDDPRQIGVSGINWVEETGSRKLNIREFLQGPQAAYLDKFGQVMGVKFPLPEDKSKW
jgi:hypothetical protein